MSEITIEPLIGPYGLGEGPHWNEKSQKLYFVDIFAQKIFRYDPQTRALTSAYIANGPVAFVIPVEGSSDKLVAGSGTDFVLISWDGEKDITCTPKVLLSTDGNRTETRWNDAKADSSGRLWGGTMGYIGDDGVFPPNVGSFYSIDNELVFKKQVPAVTISNGIAWSPNNDTLYYIDSCSYQIVAYDYNSQTGTINNKRKIFDLRENNVPGLPDGMTIDTDGNLWVAVYGGSGVLQINPRTGELLRYVKISGAKNITSVTFGGPNFDILYVTTASMDVDENQLKEQPHAGYVFAIKGLGVRGSPANSFKLADKLTL